jgi:hypothetical protein
MNTKSAAAIATFLSLTACEKPDNPILAMSDAEFESGTGRKSEVSASCAIARAFIIHTVLYARLALDCGVCAIA